MTGWRITPNAANAAQPAAARQTGRPERANFDTFIATAGLPVVVDFWASWCGPCKMMAPVFQQVAAEMGTRVRFAKVDTETHPQVSMRHHIKGIPSLILFRNGVETARHVGGHGGSRAETLAGVTGHSVRAWPIHGSALKPV